MNSSKDENAIFVEMVGNEDVKQKIILARYLLTVKVT